MNTNNKSNFKSVLAFSGVNAISAVIGTAAVLFIYVFTKLTILSLLKSSSEFSNSIVPFLILIVIINIFALISLKFDLFKLPTEKKKSIRLKSFKERAAITVVAVLTLMALVLIVINFVRFVDGIAGPQIFGNQDILFLITGISIMWIVIINIIFHGRYCIDFQ